MRFRGITKISVDAKGRIAVPKHHRDTLIESGISEIVVTADLSGCLLVYPMPVWQEIEDQLVELPNHHPKARRIQRLYIGYATPMELDATGRILLPLELREYAGVDRKVVLIGQGRKLELWDERAWAAENEAWRSDSESGDEMPPPDALQSISF
jgi:MraZ protein